MSVRVVRWAAGPWLKTPRVALHEIAAEHANELHELDSDPRVMRYIGSGRLSTREQVDDAIRRIPRIYALYPGLGTWRATRRDNGEFIGWFALKYIPRTAEVEVGYRLRYAAWGRGYATEGARALVEYGFDDLGLYRIVGVTHPDNAASQRVLRKAGLGEVGWAHYYGRRLRLFESVRNHAWKPRWPQEASRSSAAR
ncbi:MAG: GNAT family N-acetyltransferase [Betaproteobacteria bacterium]|nr:GNAT family N-acetyltransferase [Betaproteobacteria bacterium]